jgi:hypothetical protein
MLVFCNGMPRSASTWSFNVLVLLFRRLGRNVHSGYDENMHRFARDLPSAATDVVLKCHSLDPTATMLLQIGAAKVVYTWRDPADAIASFMEMFQTDFDHAFPVIAASIDLYHRHRRTGGLTLGYQQIVADPGACIARIASYLGLAAGPSLIGGLAQATGLAEVRRKLEEIGSLDYGPRLVRHYQTFYDPETMLNIDHIRHGGSGYGKDVLNQAQQRQVQALIDEKGALQ